MYFSILISSLKVLSFFLLVFAISIIKASFQRINFSDYVFLFEERMESAEKKDFVKFLGDLHGYEVLLEFFSFIVIFIQFFSLLDFIKKEKVDLFVSLFLYFIFLFIFKEVFPSLFSKKKYLNVVILFYPVLKKLKFLFYPLISLKRADISGSKADFFELFPTFIELAQSFGYNVNKKKLKMTNSLLSLFEEKVEKIRIDKKDIIYVTEGATIEDVKNKMIEENHSRIVYINNEEEWKVKGVIFIRNLLKFYNSKSKNKRVDRFEGLVFPLTTISSSATIIKLIEKMKKLSEQMLLVVNESSEVIGIVTFEDIFEEVIGDIKDEDQREKIQILKLDKNKYILDGTYEIKSFREDIGEIPEEIDVSEVSTVGGMIVSYLGRIPESGEIIDISKYHFKILDSDQRKINRIELEIGKI